MSASTPATEENPVIRPRVHMQVLESLALTMDMPEDRFFERTDTAGGMLEGLAPRSETEALLAAQMVATHHAAMECLARGARGGAHSDVRDRSLGLAVRLMTLQCRQIEALDRHRGKGQQKVTVEHVHVAAGGQAVVGHVETGGGAARSGRAGR